MCVGAAVAIPGLNASDWSAPESTRRARSRAPEARDQDVASANQRRRTRLFENDDLPTPSRIAITATPSPNPACEHGAANGMRRERTERKPSDHRMVSCSIRPSLIVSTRLRAVGQRRIVCDDDQRRAVGIDAIEQRNDMLARGLIQFASRLVREQQAGTVGERPSDRDALHLSARELVTAGDRRAAASPT